MLFAMGKSLIQLLARRLRSLYGSAGSMILLDFVPAGNSHGAFVEAAWKYCITIIFWT